MAKNRHRRANVGTDTARRVAFDSRAPADERFDAQSELQKSTMSGLAGNFLPAEELAPVIDYIKNGMADDDLAKSLSKPQLIPYPSRAAKNNQPGMQSVHLDNLQVSATGYWYDRPSAFSFDSMRTMVAQTPILAGVIGTRIRQVERFCRRADDPSEPGFNIVLKDAEAHADGDSKTSMRLLADFFTNCGWETKPRQRMRLRRDDFTGFMKKLTRDTLTMDSMPIETEWKRDRKLGLDGLYAVDGSTIRLCTEEGYNGDDEIYALQLVQGRISAVYTWDDLIYVPRNPRADVLVGGYGYSETELLVRVVTGFLNAMTYNTKFFDSNSIPKGMLHLSGNYDQPDIAAFKRYWNAMVRGVDNAWTLPVMVSKDQESKASFEAFGVEANEMMFAKWMQFLGSMICAIYSIAPEEVNLESFSAGNKSSLSGDDTTEKLSASQDKGLDPLLDYFENTFTDFVVSEFDDRYAFRFTGRKAEDKKSLEERRKLGMTWNEYRALDDLPKVEGELGDAPMNATLIGPWTQLNIQPPQDFGDPSGAPPGEPGDEGGDFGQGGEGSDFGQDSAAPTGAPTELGGPPAEEEEQGADFGKSFGLPIYSPET